MLMFAILAGQSRKTKSTQSRGKWKVGKFNRDLHLDNDLLCEADGTQEQSVEFKTALSAKNIYNEGSHRLVIAIDYGITFTGW